MNFIVNIPEESIKVSVNLIGPSATNDTMNANFTQDKTTVVNGELVTFTDTSSLSPTSWFWDFGDGNTSTVQNPTHRYRKAGTFSVTLKISRPDNLGDEVTKADLITSTITTTKSLLFDGVNDYTEIDLTKRSIMNDLSNQAPFSGITAVFWVKPVTTLSDRGFFYLGNIATNTYYFFAGPTATTLSFSVRFGAIASNLTLASALTTGVWQQIALTYDSTVKASYVNGGALSASGSVGSILSAVPSVAGIGRRVLGGAFGYAHCNMTNVAIFKRALSAPEVAECYDLGNANFNYFNHSAAADLVHWYRCGNSADDVAPTIIDVVSGANMTMFNMSAASIVEDAP